MAQMVENPETLSLASGANDVFPTVWSFERADEVMMLVDTGDGFVEQEQGLAYVVQPGDWLNSGANLIFQTGYRPPIDAVVARLRVTPIRQAEPFGDLATFKPTLSEQAYDRLTRMAQETAAKLSRSLMFPPGTATPTPDDLIAPAMTAAGEALGIAAEANGKSDSALSAAQQAQADVAEALENGITNNSGSYLRFPADGGVSTAGGGETTFLMREAVTNGNLVRVYRNGNEVIPGVHYTVNGTNVGTWTTAMAAGETWNGVHTGSEAANLASRLSYQIDMPGAGGRVLQARLNEEWRLTDLADKVADGIMNWGAALNALFAHAAAQGREIVAPPGLYLIGDVDVVTPKGTILRILPGAVFRSANGKTCKFRGTVILPDRQCFDGAGFTGIRHVAAYHFGPVIPDFNEATKAWTTDVADPMIRANACVIDAALSDGKGMSIELPSGGAFAVGKPVVFAPRLHTNFSLYGAGTGIGDTRFYSVGVQTEPGVGGAPVKMPGTGGSITIDPGVDWQNFSAFLDIECKDFFINGGADAEYSSDPLFRISNVNGLSNNRFHNIIAGEGRINFQIRNSRALTLSSIASRSGVRPGIGLHILRDGGSIFCGDFQIIDAIHISQPKIHTISKADCEAGLGPVGMLIENRAADVVPGTGLGEIRGIMFDNIVNYPGKYGWGIRILCEGLSGQKRTVGDYFFGAQQLAAGFDGPVQGFVGFDVALKGNALLNGLAFDQPWFESYYGACIRITRTAHLGITPTARTVRFSGIQVHYSTGRLIEAQGVLGLNIDGAAIENCGRADSSPGDLMRLTDCVNSRIRDVVCDRDSGVGWDGYATLLTVDGAGSRNVVVEHCVGGTANTVVRINGALDAQVIQTNNRLEGA